MQGCPARGRANGALAGLLWHHVSNPAIERFKAAFPLDPRLSAHHFHYRLKKPAEIATRIADLEGALGGEEGEGAEALPLAGPVEEWEAKAQEMYGAIRSDMSAGVQRFLRLRLLAREYQSLAWIEDAAKAEGIRKDVWWMGNINALRGYGGFHHVVRHLEGREFDKLLRDHDLMASHDTR
jgi:hypothetical protein